MAPLSSQSTNQQKSPEVGIFFGVVHDFSYYRPKEFSSFEQTIKIKFGENAGPKGIYITELKRTMTPAQIIRVLPTPKPSLTKPKAPKVPKTPEATKLLQKAIWWQEMLDKGEVSNRAAIARLEGISRACVTRIMLVLRLSPEIKKFVLAMPKTLHKPAISLNSLRSIARIGNHETQTKAFAVLKRKNGQ